MNPTRPPARHAEVARLIRKPLYAVLSSLLCCGNAGATYFVTSCADDGSSGTLRYAAAHDSSVDLSNLTCSTITLTQGALTYFDLDLFGPADRRISIVGNGSDRLFFGDHAEELALFNVNISGGRILPSTPISGGGSCILSASGGAVFLNNSTVSDCRSTAVYGVLGGAIYGAGVILNNSVVTDNPQLGYSGSAGGGVWAYQFECHSSIVRNNSISGANVSGGGVYAKKAILDACTIEGNSPGGLRVVSIGDAITVSGSTISGNSGAYALQIDNAGTLTISNSTISGNAGGGINAQRQTTTISNSTIVRNQGGTLAGGFFSQAGLTAQSSIFANNTPADIYLFRSLMSGADNLVISGNVIGHTDAGVIVSNAAPHLAPLGYHGGTTRTHALLAASPALDHGNNSGALAVDQRGAARESPTGAADIGAYERQPDDDEVFYDGYEGDG